MDVLFPTVQPSYKCHACSCRFDTIKRFKSHRKKCRPLCMINTILKVSHAHLNVRIQLMFQRLKLAPVVSIVLEYLRLPRKTDKQYWIRTSDRIFEHIDDLSILMDMNGHPDSRTVGELNHTIVKLFDRNPRYDYKSNHMNHWQMVFGFFPLSPRKHLAIGVVNIIRKSVQQIIDLLLDFDSAVGNYRADEEFNNCKSVATRLRTKYFL